MLNYSKNTKPTHYITYIKILVFNIYYYHNTYLLNILTKITPVFNLQLYQCNFTSTITFVTPFMRLLMLTKVHTEISLLIDVFTPPPPPPHRLTRKSLSVEISSPPPLPPYPAPFVPSTSPPQLPSGIFTTV